MTALALECDGRKDERDHRRHPQGSGFPTSVSKVINSYYKSLTLAAWAISFVDRAYVYDNSRENRQPTLLYRTAEGRLLKQYVSEIPVWASSLI